MTTISSTLRSTTSNRKKSKRLYTKTATFRGSFAVDVGEFESFGGPCSGRRARAALSGCGHRTVSAARSVACGDVGGHGTANSTEVSAVAQKLTPAQRRALREEARGWDELSDEEFARLSDEGKPVQIRLRRPPPKTLTVALDAQTLNRLRRIARRKQVGPRQLAAIWIAERLGREQAPGGSWG